MTHNQVRYRLAIVRLGQVPRDSLLCCSANLSQAWLLYCQREAASGLGIVKSTSVKLG